MKEELKNKIISTLQYLAGLSSKDIFITDRISTNRDNYDRHFTTTSRLKFRLKHFGVRFSGGIAMLDGENQSFEFRTDSIKEIVRVDNKIEITISVKEDVFRYLEIEIRPLGNDEKEA